MHALVQRGSQVRAMDEPVRDAFGRNISRLAMKTDKGEVDLGFVAFGLMGDGAIAAVVEAGGQSCDRHLGQGQL